MKSTPVQFMITYDGKTGYPFKFSPVEFKKEVHMIGTLVNEYKK